MQTQKKLIQKKPADPYQQLSKRMSDISPLHAHEFGVELFYDVGFYIKKRMKMLIDDTEVLALLEGAIVRLKDRLDSSESELINPAAYYRTIVRNLVNDYYRDLLSDERFCISLEAIDILSNSGFPQKIIEQLSASSSPKLLTLRTLRSKLKSILEAHDVSQSKRQYLQREAIKAFRFYVSVPLEQSQLENLPEVQNENSSLAQLGDCLQQFQKKDRDLIRLKFGLDGIHFSFDELRDLFQASSTRQIQNRYYYLLKGLRSCLKTKGFHFG